MCCGEGDENTAFEDSRIDLDTGVICAWAAEEEVVANAATGVAMTSRKRMSPPSSALSA